MQKKWNPYNDFVSLLSDNSIGLLSNWLIQWFIYLVTSFICWCLWFFKILLNQSINQSFTFALIYLTCKWMMCSCVNKKAYVMCNANRNQDVLKNFFLKNAAPRIITDSTCMKNRENNPRNWIEIVNIRTYLISMFRF